MRDFCFKAVELLHHQVVGGVKTKDHEVKVSSISRILLHHLSMLSDK